MSAAAAAPADLLTISFNGLGEEPVKSLLLLNERNGAAEYLRVVVRQVNALPAFHTDKRISPRDAQQRLILQEPHAGQRTGSLKTAHVSTMRKLTEGSRTQRQPGAGFQVPLLRRR